MADHFVHAGDEPARAVAHIKPLVSRTLIALDFDGTLAPIVERPEDARAVPQAAEVLTRLAERGAAVAIVTGRPAAEAVELSGLAAVPGLVVRGHYGLERWTAGSLAGPEHVAGVDDARARVAALVGDRPGVAVEDKGHSVAVHTRRSPDPAGELENLRPEVAKIAADCGLEVTPGRFVLELRPGGVDKGTVLRELVAQTSAAAVVYAGDDVGDIPAVDAVRAMQSEGLTGFVICSEADAAVPELRDRADLVVPGPDGVMKVLRALLD